MLEFFRWLQSTGLATSLRESGLAFPIVLSLHLTGMGLFGGMIAVTDMRLLGIAFKKYPIEDVVKGLRPWKHVGGLLTIGCGALLLSAKAEFYYWNPFYWTKMIFLLLVLIHAIVFHGVYSNPAALDAAPKIPAKAKAAACISLLLWIGLVTFGRSIAYYDVPEDKMPVYGISTADHHPKGQHR